MGPRDLHSTTWYLNKVRLRALDHFPVVVNIEGKDLRTKKGVKGRASWIQSLRKRRTSFKNSVGWECLVTATMG